MNGYPHDLAPSYALDALDEEEMALFERHLAGCEECRLEVAELKGVVGVLPLALADLREPSPAVRTRVLNAIAAEETPEDAISTAGPSPIPLRPERPAWFIGTEPLLAAAAILVIAALGIWNVILQTHHYPGSNAYDRAVVQALANGAAVSRLAGTGGRAAVVQPPQGRAYLILHGLHPLTRQEVYQLWFLRAGRPYSAGVFTVPSANTTTVQTTIPAAGYTLAAVTVEPGPRGSPQPTGPKVLIGSLHT